MTPYVCLTGAFAGLIDNLRVELYGEKVPLRGLGSVAVRDPQLLAVSAFDPQVQQAKPLKSISIVHMLCSSCVSPPLPRGWIRDHS